jgi:hypothetical protein
MGISPHSYQLLRRKGQIGVNGLWQVAHLLRNLTQLPPPLIASADQNQTCFRLAKPRNDIE